MQPVLQSVWRSFFRWLSVQSYLRSPSHNRVTGPAFKDNAMHCQTYFQFWGVRTGPGTLIGQQNPGLKTLEPFTAVGQVSTVAQARLVATPVPLLAAQTHVQCWH